MNIKCPICKNKVELEHTDETVSCGVCGYHYLDKCPKCGAKFNFEGMNVRIFDGDKWELYSEEDLENKNKNKIKLTDKECRDLYDLLYMLPAGDVKVNSCLESYQSIFDKLEEFCIPELNIITPRFIDEEDLEE